MEIFPAIDLIGGQAVRLVRGDYAQKTVYNDDPLAVARSFAQAGASYLHLVDLQGAKIGAADQFAVIKNIIQNSGLQTEIGGGIRNRETVERYLQAGAYRVILGTAAVTDPAFLEDCVRRYGEKIAVGVDIKDGMVAIRGWTELSAFTCAQFFARMEAAGVGTVICTDISKDGLLQGIDAEWYGALSRQYSGRLVASGGVSSLADVAALKAQGLYGAILGKALYTGHIDLAQAVRTARGEPV